MRVIAARLSGSWEVVRRPLLLTAIAALSLKLVWFAIDRVPLFYMGDSWSYVYSAIWGGHPFDRSRSYEWLLWLISVLPGTLTTLVIAQSLAGAATAWILAFCLLHDFKVRPAFAVAAAVVFAIEPLQILHERMVLTESFTMLMLAVYLRLCFSYFAGPRVFTLIALAATGVMLLSLRLVFVPVTLFGAVLVPLLSGVMPRGERAATNKVRRLLGHLAVSLFVTLGLHQLYKTANGVKANFPPAYQYKSGFFLSSAWAPLIEPEDALDPRARRVVEMLLDSSTYPLRDFGARDDQLWREGGLTSEMKKAFGGDTYSANEAAGEMSQRTLRRVPLSVLRLTARSYLDYWRPSRMRSQLLDEQGTLRGPEQDVLANLQKWFNLDAGETAATMTPSKRYHLLGAPWYVVLTVSPLIGLLCARWVPREARPGALLLAIFGAMLLIVPCATTVGMAVRFLHPLVFGTLVALAVIADETSRRIRTLKGDTLRHA